MVPPTQPPQNVTDPSQPFVIPPPTGVNSSGPVNVTVGIFRNESGTLVPVLPGLNPGDTLTPEQIRNITSDPNNQPLVVVYNVSNEAGSNVTTAPITIAHSPLDPALPELPATVTKMQTNASGSDATGFVPTEIANYLSMPYPVLLAA
jgi:hypothetical protein